MADSQYHYGHAFIGPEGRGANQVSQKGTTVEFRGGIPPWIVLRLSLAISSIGPGLYLWLTYLWGPPVIAKSSTLHVVLALNAMITAGLFLWSWSLLSTRRTVRIDCVTRRVVVTVADGRELASFTLGPGGALETRRLRIMLWLDNRGPRDFWCLVVTTRLPDPRVSFLVLGSWPTKDKLVAGLANLPVVMHPLIQDKLAEHHIRITR